MEKINVNASRDKDMREILRQFKLLESVEKGSIYCEFCETAITWENLAGLVTRADKQPLLICYSESCIEEASHNAAS